MEEISRSLSTRMPKDVEILQAKLDAFLRIAKNNEQKQANFQEYELALLNSSGLNDLLSIILEQHRERFQLSEVTLLLVDPEYEFQRLIDNIPTLEKWKDHLFFTDNANAINQYFTILRKPRLSAYSEHIHRQLFTGKHTLHSVAILPLVRRKKFIGCLNLGSRSPNRFQDDMGTQFLQHVSAVISACIENARLQENIKQTGLLDPLTGINNRRFFDQRIDEEVMRSRRNKSPLCCLFIDLDHFKSINDNYGHQAGDKVLQQVATLLSDIMRTTDVLARFGGEEFVILLSESGREISFEIAERIRTIIANHDFVISPTKTLNVTLSIGLAMMHSASQIKTSADLLKAADQAVYAAKVSGRNRVHHAN